VKNFTQYITFFFDKANLFRIPGTSMISIVKKKNLSSPTPTTNLPGGTILLYRCFKLHHMARIFSLTCQKDWDLLTRHPFAVSSHPVMDDHHRSVNLCNPPASKHLNGGISVKADHLSPQNARNGG